MIARSLVLCALVGLAGCASGGQGAEDGDRITVVVVNEYPSAITAYAVWPGGRPRRLGEVSANRTRTFEVPRQGNEIAVGLELVSAPPVGTVAGGRPGSPPRINPEMVTSESLLISPNEGIEWRLTSNGSLVYRRIAPL